VVTEGAFAARMQDGSLVTWDQSTHGANSSAVQAQLAGVQSVCATREAFAALKAADGSVVTWGDPSMGGDSSSSTVGAFAAVTQSGRVVTWGSDADGGNSSSVAHKLTNVEFAYPTWHALAAKTSNSSLVTRGDPAAGGDSSVVADAISSGIADDPGFVPTTTMTYTFTSVTSTSMTSTSSTATTATTSSGTTSTTTVTSTSLTTSTSSTSTTSSTRAPQTSFGGVSIVGKTFSSRGGVWGRNPDRRQCSGWLAALMLMMVIAIWYAKCRPKGVFSAQCLTCSFQPAAAAPDPV